MCKYLFWNGRDTYYIDFMIYLSLSDDLSILTRMYGKCLHALMKMTFNFHKQNANCFFFRLGIDQNNYIIVVVRYNTAMWYWYTKNLWKHLDRQFIVSLQNKSSFQIRSPSIYIYIFVCIYIKYIFMDKRTECRLSYFDYIMLTGTCRLSGRFSTITIYVISVSMNDRNADIFSRLLK